MPAYILSTGAYRPRVQQPNHALTERFFLKRGNKIHQKATVDILEKFTAVTEIRERSIALPEVSASRMGYLAAEEAIERGGVDREAIDYIIVAHNWGDVSTKHNFQDTLPNLAARIKSKLGIRNPRCVAYDILFGCPGWLEGVRQVDLLIRSGEARYVLVVGTDTVSRVVEEYDVDSLLFSDGAGAALMAASASPNTGVLASATRSHCLEELDYLRMGRSFSDRKYLDGLYLKMQGRQVFKYALREVPAVITACLEKAEVDLRDVRYFIMHQANAKMIKAIASRLFAQHGIANYPEDVLPINVYTKGNNSVATIPTLLHEVIDRAHNQRGIERGDLVVFASVGAGMHVNAMIHRF
ncbi:3-oxoacyl-ACP synthase III family protein [Neolewinella agarilytica]|uniref:3-oxoacyl-[acyl-carrier-protein] synthase-3 n=1 Tax=Neolewinella agarilytica TaxID=478744 RepID=A0A1H9H945_9BACT|nr:3-oxoacyl-[acyl-carrier-protein] synthase III C-terminal domain-containing protein [Neolewinella agarilytica]SEQ58899.1 3-oxoacyl-[acyl-carrier-protein] synthase-3 [Neolewinella agarilytica]